MPIRSGRTFLVGEAFAPMDPSLKRYLTHSLLEVTGFERLKEEYESCPEFEEIYAMLWDGSAREMDEFLL